jgi:hypothetical protein
MHILMDRERMDVFPVKAGALSLSTMYFRNAFPAESVSRKCSLSSLRRRSGKHHVDWHPDFLHDPLGGIQKDRPQPHGPEHAAMKW